MKTKLFSAIIMVAVVLICLIALPTEANAAEIGEGGIFDQSLSWTLNDEGTLTISGSGAMRNYDYDAQSPWYACREQIKHVVIEDGITRIGVNAFYGCSNLTRVTIPEGVATIADRAFYGCSKLTDIAIPNSVNRICANAFRNCTGLTSMTIPDGVSFLDVGTFYGCSGLTGVNLPDGITGIRGFAFYGCSSLTGITIPEGVTSIDECAFRGCASLTDIKLPESVTAIGKYAFEGCKALANVTYCGTEEQWDEISIQSNNEPLANAMRSYHSYTNGECTFCGHRLVYTVTFKDWNGTVLSSQACYWGDAVTAPAAPTKAADKTYTYAFAGWNAEVVPCAGNATYTATYSKSYINYTVEFRDWNGNFISVKIYHWGDAVTAPADPVRAANETYTYAFAGWDKEVVACAGDATYTATYSENYINYTITFRNWNGDVISLKTYHWGDAVTAPADPTRAADETYTYVFTGWDREVAVCAGDAIYTATYLKQCRDAFLYTIENGQVTITDYVGSDDILLIPGFIEGLPVVGIGSSAFSESVSLTKVTIPQSVVSIDENAFNGCTSIVKVVIPDSVAAIGHSAFQGTPWYTAKIAQSGEWLIVGDGVLLKYSGTGATEVTVPASVKYISDAFRGNTELIKITVNAACKTIGQYAFADCAKLQIIGLPMKLDYIASNSVAGCTALHNIKNIDYDPAAPETITPIETVPPVQPKPEGVTPASIKVMSWNVWHENVWEGQCTNWERLAKVVDVVEYFNPDVLMTQETTDWWVIYLMQNLPSQYTWAYTHSNGHDTKMPELDKNNKNPDETHSAIFYNQEKLELLDNGLFWLSETPNVMSKYYESWCFRIISWAKFRDKATGREFICIDVHLDDETDEPYKILMDFVTKNIETPTIMAGDFNRRSDEDIMKKLNTYTPLKDASNGTEGKSNIDWVYVSRNTVEVLSYKHGVVDGIEKPSDHKPRVVELLIY